MITLSCTKRCEYMVLTGVWIAGSNVTEPLQHWRLRVCACVRTASPPHGVVSLNTGRVSWRFAVHCPHSVLPHPALSRVHALSACDGNVGSPLNSREEINKGEHLQTEVSFTSANLKIDDDGPHFSGSKKQVALRDSLHLSKIWRME